MENYGIRGVRKAWFISYLSHRKQIDFRSAYITQFSINIYKPRSFYSTCFPDCMAIHCPTLARRKHF